MENNYEKNEKIEIRATLQRLRLEIIKLEKTLDPNSGCGFDPEYKERLLYKINFKKDEENRLSNRLNELDQKKIKIKANVAIWISAIAATSKIIAR